MNFKNGRVKTMKNLKDIEQLTEDLLITAVEGGSNYWLELTPEAKEIARKYWKKPMAFSEAIYAAISAGESLEIIDVENGDTLGHLTIKKCEGTFKLMHDEFGFDYADLLTGQWDALTADLFIQLAVMGEVIYG